LNDNYFAFGPVPSRRLGRSLGVNNIPPKYCSFACIYCQLGNTIRLTEARQKFYEPEEIFQAVKNLAEKTFAKGEKIDYITLVPDGEPTLDLNLEELAKNLKTLGIPLAIISNSSLIWEENVRKALGLFDWVSLKVDSVSEKLWKQIDRPYGKLELKKVLEGIENFAKDYKGFLATETMLVRGFNDTDEELRAIAKFIGRLNTDAAYVSVPTRPPAENFVLPPEEAKILKAYEIFSERIKNVELNINYEGGNFASTGDFRNDFLGIISVHPMREDAVYNLLNKTGERFETVENLLRSGIVLKKEYNGKVYFLRNLKGVKNGKNNFGSNRANN